MTPPPSARLEFRLWDEGDLELAEMIWGDPEVTRLIAAGPVDPAARLADEIACERRHRVQYWPVYERGSGELVGCAGLRPYAIDDGIWELGVHLRRRYWGAGLAAEAARAVIDHAFGALAIRALFAGHNPANDASRRLLARLGFRHIGDQRYEPTGLDHPSYLLESPEG